MAAIQSIQTEDLPEEIPKNYQKLIKKYHSLTNPDFKKAKHSVEHSIDTGNATPVRTKARPLLPGSPKAEAGYKAWHQMLDLGIIERVDPSEPHYWSSALHLGYVGTGSIFQWDIGQENQAYRSKCSKSA